VARALLIGIIAYWAFRLISRVVRFYLRISKSAGISEQGDRGPEQLVQDPVCKLNLPRSQATSYDSDGEVLYFCSKRCKDIYADAANKPLH